MTTHTKHTFFVVYKESQLLFKRLNWGIKALTCREGTTVLPLIPENKVSNGFFAIITTCCLATAVTKANTNIFKQYNMV